MGTQGNKGKSLLPDVVLIRLFLIVILVLYHSLCPYTGGWSKFEGQVDIPGYGMFAVLLYSCLLETWVFMSGYVLGFQVAVKGNEALSFRKCVLGKCRRLLIPCIVFGILYYLILAVDNSEYPLHIVVYRVINGVGHLWFLPMLLWCFVFTFLIERFKLPWRFTLPVLFIVSVFSKSDFLAFRFGDAAYYMFFFYLGFITKKNGLSVKLGEGGKKSVFYISGLFVLLFAIARIIADRCGLTDSAFSPLYHGRNVLGNILMLAYSTAGVIMIFHLVNGLLKKSVFKNTTTLVKFSGMTFGVYLLQEIFLKLLYTKVNMTQVTPHWMVPWIAALLSLIISFGLTYAYQTVEIARKKIN